MTNLNSIAVVGMSARFPGARDVDEYWENLKNGIEAVSFLSDEQLRSAGADARSLLRRNYVKASINLEGIENFDAEFFGYSPQQAAGIDPQQRLFLESAWAAVENAGYDVSACGQSIGVFAGSGVNRYLFVHARRLLGRGNFADAFQTLIDSDKDFLATRVSYKLNLGGPSVAIQTACSTSLVAVHMACQSLLNFECDMALAGGVSLQIPQNTGYVYEEGGIMSSDGHCRAFDRKATGIVAGSGAGVVLLRRLEDAVKDGDTINAIIRGSAINNDGSRKAGYTAPGIHGQSLVIASALAMARLEPRQIGFIEGHGTGTELGDAVELSALTDVFRAKTSDVKFCALGSVKTNIGHLDAAAGVAGLIKTILCLKNKAFVPSLNFETPNDVIDVANSPFYVNTELRAWERGSYPRYAAVSSFGIGGTNAHVILEEPPDAPPVKAAKDCHIVPLSARKTGALAAIAGNLASFLKRQPTLSLPDLAYTMQVGRKRFSCRMFAVASSNEELIDQLEHESTERAFDEGGELPVIFMFPGQGTPWSGTVVGLYESEPIFRREMDQCAKLIADRLGFDIRRVVCRAKDDQSSGVGDARISQSALFAIEYSLARLFIAWGVRPSIMIAQSFGEYAAACVSEVISMEDAIRLVCARAQALPDIGLGAMVAVSLSEDEVRKLLRPSLSLAAVNSPSQCLVSGAVDQVDEFEVSLSSLGVQFRRLSISQAGHSPMMEPAARAVMEAASRISFSAPKIPYITCLTAKRVTQSQLAAPEYWGGQVLNTVRFSAALVEATQGAKSILVEVGPGESLTRLARQQLVGRKDLVLPMIEEEKANDRRCLLALLGKLWLRGSVVDWGRFHSGSRRQRVALPTYPFERERHWVKQQHNGERGRNLAGRESRKPASQWFYTPSWKYSSNPLSMDDASLQGRGRWLVFLDGSGLGEGLVGRLKAADCDFTTVVVGERYQELDDNTFSIDPRSADEYRRLAEELKGRGRMPSTVIHCWSLTRDLLPWSIDEFDRVQELGYLSLLQFVKELGKDIWSRAASILILSNYLYSIGDEQRCAAEKATLPALCKVISQEFAGINCRVIDLPRPDRAEVEKPGPGSAPYEAYIDRILVEALHPTEAPIIAYRGRSRLVQTYEQVKFSVKATAARRLRMKGVYVITGGLGKIGLVLAEYLAREYQARIILISRSPLPERDQWDSLSEETGPAATVQIVQRIRAMEACGAQIWVIARDVGDPGDTRRIIDEVETRYGAINGVFHLAGAIADSSLHRPIKTLGRQDFETQIRPKVRGFYALEDALREKGLDFGIAFSSNASILGGGGFGAYAAANAFLDHVVTNRDCSRKFDWIAVNWDGWLAKGEQGDSQDMTMAEGLEALLKVISFSAVPNVIVSTTNLFERVDRWTRLREGERPDNGASSEPDVPSDRIPPRNNLERAIAGIWKEVLGSGEFGVEDSFIECGGDSLIALRVVLRIRELFQVGIPLRSLLGPEKTIAGLAIDVVAQLAQRSDLSEVGERISTIEQKELLN